MLYSEQVRVGPWGELNFAQGSISSQRATDLLALVGNEQDQGDSKMARKVVSRVLPYVRPHVPQGKF